VAAELLGAGANDSQGALAVLECGRMSVFLQTVFEHKYRDADRVEPGGDADAAVPPREFVITAAWAPLRAKGR